MKRCDGEQVKPIVNSRWSRFFYKYRKKVINVGDDLLNLSAEAISSLRGPLKNYKEWGDPGRLGSCALSEP